MDASERVSKEQFVGVYNKHLPNGWIKFFFRYFSTNTVKKDMYVRRIFQGIEGALFLAGFIGTILGAKSTFVGGVTIPFTIGLLLLGLGMGSSAILNNLRIRKIRKALKLTKEEYNYLVLLYIE